jgi:PelA/Pel-15E family pectate lyase
MNCNKVIVRLALSAVFAAYSLAAYTQDAVADNMLLFQRSEGGWPKHYEEKAIDYNRVYSDVEKAAIKDEHNRNDATIDNKATTKEIRYLLKMYKQLNNKTYLQAAEKGIKYLLDAQYANGGFPQFYPDLSSYRHEITYNDDAMINALNILWDVAKKTNNFEVVNAAFIPKAEKALQRGIQCILKTQIKVKKQLTAWCAQYDENTLQPAMARKFELVSISGNESVGIVKFLMKIENPSTEIKNAIIAAVEWFEKVKIKGYKYVDITDAAMPNGKDRVIVADTSSTIWARFYEIGTNTPFFSGRDSIKKYKVSEIEHERRVGYGWYGTWPKELLEKEYPTWRKKYCK